MNFPFKAPFDGLRLRQTMEARERVLRQVKAALLRWHQTSYQWISKGFPRDFIGISWGFHRDFIGFSHQTESGWLDWWDFDAWLLYRKPWEYGVSWERNGNLMGNFTEIYDMSVSDTLWSFIENGPVEIVRFPIDSMVIVHSFVIVYQRVPPENFIGDWWDFMGHWWF